jgi:hypothetical protein
MSREESHSAALHSQQYEEAREMYMHAQSERDEWRKYALEKKSERDKLREQMKKESIALEHLQQKRFRLVIHDLITTIREKHLSKKRPRFDQVVNAEVRSRTRPLEKRLEAEAKRQEHNRKIQEALQQSSLKALKLLEETSDKLQKAKGVLIKGQDALVQAQQDYVVKAAGLQRDIAKLKAILKAHDTRARKRGESITGRDKTISGERERLEEEGRGSKC